MREYPRPCEGAGGTFVSFREHDVGSDLPILNRKNNDQNRFGIDRRQLSSSNRQTYRQTVYQR